MITEHLLVHYEIRLLFLFDGRNIYTIVPLSYTFDITISQTHCGHLIYLKDLRENYSVVGCV